MSLSYLREFVAQYNDRSDEFLRLHSSILKVWVYEQVLRHDKTTYLNGELSSGKFILEVDPARFSHAQSSDKSNKRFICEGVKKIIHRQRNFPRKPYSLDVRAAGKLCNANLFIASLFVGRARGECTIHPTVQSALFAAGE